MTTEQTISIALEHLCDSAERNLDGNDINSALGELTINGITYQMQVSFIANKKLWLGESEVRFSEVVKIHTQ